ncbi:hypothetical protein IF188_17820 [Microbacterium sp. NEAU-LLC]|uniref:Uncharacterized protein n=1 Tax=Microbacterium helvum TaxID=2773713 RepID=A0ABR8NUY1_9MICO|nr:hypothetical protein [Microbacterium helvum]MBD3943552.1 hypothetical protein [Microbacterium helvum]
MPHPPVPQRFFVDADVLARPTPFCWLAMLRDETDGAFRLHSSDDALTAATAEWRMRHPDAGGAALRREELLRTVLDDVTNEGEPAAAPTPDEFLCLVDDDDAKSVRALTGRRQHDIERRLAAGIPSTPLADALVDAGCPAFADRVAAHVRALAH